MAIMNTHEMRNEVLAFLDKFAQVAQEFDFKHTAKRVEEWSRKLKERGYNVVFMGKIKVGKSTLLNALLGEELFPTGPVPLTPIITTYTYDPQRTRVTWKEGEESTILLEGQNISAAQIYQVLEARFKDFNEGLAQKYDIDLKDEEAVLKKSQELESVKVDIRYSAGQELAGITLIDTPGTQDLYQARAEVVDSLIPLADVSVVLLDATQGLTKTEQNFIRDRLWNPAVPSLFFTLNKFDLPNTDEDRVTVENHVRDVLHHTLDTDPPLCSLSAHLALRGIQWRDGKVDWEAIKQKEKKLRWYKSPEELLEESKLTPFYQELWQYLGRSMRMARQISNVVHQALSEVRQVLRQEFKTTQELLGGKGKGDVADAVQRLEALKQKKEGAEKDLKILDYGKQRVQERLKLRSSQLIDLPVFATSIEEDTDYEVLDKAMRTLIERNSFKDLKGVAGTQGLFIQHLQPQWADYWGKKFEEITNELLAVEEEARKLANNAVKEALQKISLQVGEELAVPSQLQEAITAVKKPWLGRAVGVSTATVGGVAATVLTAGWVHVIAPPMAPLLVATGGQLGERLDETWGKEKFNDILAQLMVKVNEYRGEMREKAREQLQILEKDLAQQMESKRQEIQDELKKDQAETVSSEQLVKKKQEWLGHFQPQLEDLEHQVERLVQALA